MAASRLPGRLSSARRNPKKAGQEAGLQAGLPAPLFRFSGRFRESRVVYRNVVLCFRDLNCKSTVRPRERPAEWNLDAVDIAIIGVINLCRIPAQRCFAVTDQS